MKSLRTGALVGPVRLARNLVTNAEWLAFMKDGGYGTAHAVADRTVLPP